MSLDLEFQNMDKVLSFGGNYPAYVFPKIEEVFHIRNGYTPSKAVNAFWTNGTIPWFRMEDIRQKGGILDKAIQNITPKAIRGEGLFEPYSIIMATTATIGEHAMIIADSLANQRFTNLAVRKSLKNNYDPYYIYYAFFKIDNWAKENTNSGGLLSVDIKSLLKLPFPTPSLEEQKLLASYFLKIDNLIDSQQKKVGVLKQMKEASLISMFPQEGETKPRVRFKGFEDEWRYIKLSDIATFDKGRGYSKADIKEEGQPLMLYGRMYTDYRLVIDNPQIFTILKPNSKISKGGEIIIPSSGETPEDIACASVISKPGIILGGDLNIIYLNKQDYDPVFIALSLSHGSANKFLVKNAQGKTVVHLHNSEIQKVEMPIPTIAEQEKIAAFFINLDEQIRLEGLKLEKLKQIKAACLDKMFV